MTETLLVAGTASHVGKSTIATGLCRLLADCGLDVAPFKAQNMSNNARVVLRSAMLEGGDTASFATETSQGGADASKQAGDPAAAERPGADIWGEIGVSQFVQARAARRTPTTDCNPVLLKPRGDGESQLVLDGRAIAHLPAGSYYDEYWERALQCAETAYRRLAATADVVIAEGAGSIAEINLHDRDLANVETARFADASVIVCVDIERGGAFASLYGTLELLPDTLRDRVVGAVITKFRGDPTLLDPGIEELEDRTGVPILGVVPYDDPGLPEEDSVALPSTEERETWGDDPTVAAERTVTVAVPRLPRISNATDLEVLARVPGVCVEFLPVTPGEPPSLADADAVVLPGTKNTVDDLLALKTAGYEDALAHFEGPIVGVCGGYQLLGRQIRNATLEGTGGRETVRGFDLLPVETEFGPTKRLEQTTVTVEGVGPIEGASGTATGYEIHAGETRALEPVDRPLGHGSAASGHVLGTYLHGIFDNACIRDAFVDATYAAAGVERPSTTGDPTAGGIVEIGATEETAFDRAGALVADNVDLAALGDPFDRLT